MLGTHGTHGTHGTYGTCWGGPNSIHHIRVARARSPLGPCLEHLETPMLRGGGKMVVSARGRNCGPPGPSGLIQLDGGVEKFSMHDEADLDRSGYAPTLATDVARVPFDPRRNFMARPTDPVAPLPDQPLVEDSAVWPKSRMRVDVAD